MVKYGRRKDFAKFNVRCKFCNDVKPQNEFKSLAYRTCKECWKNKNIKYTSDDI